MKSACIILVLFPLALCGLVRGTVTIDFQFGQLSTSQSAVLPVGSLWAIISENNSGDLPGGLALDGEFSSGFNTQAILADFAGATVAPQQQIGGGVVIATGEATNSGLALGVANLDFADFTGLGLNAGDQLGLYWFPGLTQASNVVPTDADFEIGGFHRSALSVESGGDRGMSMPADGNTVTIAYLDSVTTGGATSFDPVLFQAVTVPEPSTLSLIMGAAFLLMRRRR